MGDIFRKDGLYFRRFEFWYPWGITRPWLPRIFKGGDEWCNVPLCFVVPPLGCFLFYHPWKELRDFPCTECWLAMCEEQCEDYLSGGELVGGRPKDHPVAEINAWLRSWAATLRMMIFDRENHRFLRDSKFSEDDFIEALRPE